MCQNERICMKKSAFHTTIVGTRSTFKAKDGMHLVGIQSKFAKYILCPGTFCPHALFPGVCLAAVFEGLFVWVQYVQMLFVWVLYLLAICLGAVGLGAVCLGTLYLVIFVQILFVMVRFLWGCCLSGIHLSECRFSQLTLFGYSGDRDCGFFRPVGQLRYGQVSR